MVYAPPKSGKTVFTTSLPFDRWGDCVYVAADRGSEQLLGVRPQAREHIRIEKPEDLPHPKGNAMKSATEIATTDWHLKEGFTPEKPGVIVWDTLSQTTMDVFRWIVAQERYSHVNVGQKGTANYVAAPDRGDYGMAQGFIDNVIGFLFQQRCHVIVVCHADYDTPNPGDPGGMVGGPMTIGKAQIREVGREFSCLLHLETSRGADGKAQYKVFTAPHGIWQAGIRMNGVSIPDTVLSSYPVDFWCRLDDAIMEGASHE